MAINYSLQVNLTKDTDFHAYDEISFHVGSHCDPFYCPGK